MFDYPFCLSDTDHVPKCQNLFVIFYVCTKSQFGMKLQKCRMVPKFNLYKPHFYLILNSTLLLYVLRILKNPIEPRSYGFFSFWISILEYLSLCSTIMYIFLMSQVHIALSHQWLLEHPNHQTHEYSYLMHEQILN